MGPFIRFLGAILAAAVAGLLVVIFQGPIARQFSADRISAEVQAGPWVPLATAGEDQKKIWEQQLGAYAAEKLLRGETVYAATWHLENQGAKRVDNIRMDFDVATPQIAIVIQRGQPLKQFNNPDHLILAAMDPGSKATIYMISVFDLTSIYNYKGESLKTYSSEGPISIKLISPKVSYSQDKMAGFIDEVVMPFVFVAFSLIGILALAIAAHYTTFAEAVIKDILIYRREKRRYDLAPKSYDYSIKKP